MAAAGKKRVLLVGATGQLGALIARALLDKPDVALRCLVRPESRHKLAQLEAAGAEVVEGDLRPGNEQALARACEGVWSVVSAVQGGPDVIIDGQLLLLRAALSAGVRRFIPSDFSYELFKLADGININSDWRRQFGRLAAQEAGTRMEVVHVLNGVFPERGVMSFVGLLDSDKGVARYWGDGNVPIEFTTYSDTALYTAEVATDPQPVPQRVYVAGDTLTFHELVRAWQEQTGRKLTVEHAGSLEELRKETQRRQQAEPQNIYGWLSLMYAWGIFSGETRLGPPMNARYPHIRPATVRDAIRQGKL